MPTYINFSPNWRANQANMSDEQIRKAAEEETRRNLARLRDLSSLYLPTPGLSYTAQRGASNLARQATEFNEALRETLSPPWDPTAGVDDTRAFDARLIPPISNNQDVSVPEELVDRLLAEDPAYIELTRQIEDLTNQMGALEAARAEINAAAAEATSNLAGVSEAAAAAARQAGEDAAAAAQANAAAAQAAIEEDYAAARANLDRVLERVSADTATASGTAAVVETWKEEVLDHVERTGENAANVARAAAEAAADQAVAEGAIDATEREGERALYEAGLVEAIEVASQTRERARQDQERLREMLRKDLEELQRETLREASWNLDVPLGETEFGLETITDDWINEVAAHVGLGAMSEVDRQLFRDAFQDLLPYASDPERFKQQNSVLALDSLFEELDGQVALGNLSADAIPPRELVRFRNGRFDINRDALIPVVLQKAKAEGNYRLEEAIEAAMAAGKRMPGEVQAEISKIVAPWQQALSGDAARSAAAHYRALEAARQRYSAAVKARNARLSAARKVEPYTTEAASLFYDAAIRIGMDRNQARQLATDPYLHQLMRTVNPGGRVRTKANRGVGLFNLPQSTVRASAPHIDKPLNQWNALDHAEAALLYLYSRYGGDTRAALETLADRGRW